MFQKLLFQILSILSGLSDFHHSGWPYALSMIRNSDRLSAQIATAYALYTDRNLA